jgi:hypothetical protein
MMDWMFMGERKKNKKKMKRDVVENIENERDFLTNPGSLAATNCAT